MKWKPLPPDQDFSLQPEEALNISRQTARLRNGATQKFRVPIASGTEEEEIKEFSSYLQRHIKHSKGAVKQRQFDSLLKIVDKPSAEVYPLLHFILAGWDAQPERVNDAQRVRAALLWELYDSGLFLPVPKTHRLSGLVDWLIEPSKFSESESLFEVCSALSLHGDETLFRHMVTMFELWSPTWQNPGFSLRIGCRIAGYCITYGLYRETLAICRAMRKQFIPAISAVPDHELSSAKWINTIERLELNAQCNKAEGAELDAVLSTYADYVERMKTLYLWSGEETRMDREQLLISACRGYARAAFRCFLNARINSYTPRFDEDTLGICTSFLNRAAAVPTSLVESFSYDHVLNEDSLCRLLILQSEVNLRQVGYETGIEHVGAAETLLRKKLVELKEKVNALREPEDEHSVCAILSNNLMEICRSTEVMRQATVKIDETRLKTGLYFFAIYSLTCASISLQLARLGRLTGSSMQAIEIDLRQASDALRMFVRRVGLDKIHHNRELYRILQSLVMSESLINRSRQDAISRRV